MGEQHAERGEAVTPLELFFDLVFAFGFTQVTTVLSDNSTWSGLAHGLLILGVLWWAWAAYAWLTNTVDPDLGPVLAAMLVATGRAELGITFTSELQPNTGVKVAGPLPAAIQLPTIYSAAITTTSGGSAEAARAFLRALAGAEGHTALRKAGLDPLVSAR